MIPDGFLDLVDDQVRSYAFLSTLMPDGSPHITPVWFEYRLGHFWVNTVEGRVKDRNMRQRPQVSLLIMDLPDPFRYLLVRGRVTERDTSRQAKDHIGRLATKYGAVARFPHLKEMDRVIYRIRPEHVSSMG
jgi:PPOX class probable F420-dependent enzyme